MSKVFNPQEWLEVNSKPSKVKYKSPTNTVVGDSLANVEQLVSKIESSCIDITQGYENWRNIGFSLSESFGESGRSYFHRLSRLNSDYSSNKCDKQYSNCLNCRGGGITIASLFWIAKTYGVTLKNKI